MGSDRVAADIGDSFPGIVVEPSDGPVLVVKVARLQTGYVEYAAADGAVRGYLARPAGAEERLPGYVALAPDGLSYVGGALEDQEASRDRFAQADRERITADLINLSHEVRVMFRNDDPSILCGHALHGTGTYGEGIVSGSR